MAHILLVCTGNVCRSPIAEGMLRSMLRGRFDAAAPTVASAGTGAWVGSAADPSSVAAAAELGFDLTRHRGRQLVDDDVRAATLVLTMAHEHARALVELAPSARPKTFTLKGFVRVVEALPPVDGVDDPVRVLEERVADADRSRSRTRERGWADDDVADPLGMPLYAFRAVAADLELWCRRLVDGVFGRAAPARTQGSRTA